MLTVHHLLATITIVAALVVAIAGRGKVPSKALRRMFAIHMGSLTLQWIVGAVLMIGYQRWSDMSLPHLVLGLSPLLVMWFFGHLGLRRPGVMAGALLLNAFLLVVAAGLAFSGIWPLGQFF